MKRTRFTEEQIIGVLKEAEAGAKIANLAPRHGVLETQRLKELECENAKLKRHLDDAMLDQAALKDLLAKSFDARRQATNHVHLKWVKKNLGARLGAIFSLIRKCLLVSKYYNRCSSHLSAPPLLPKTF
tara:strand:+ start:17922 stop:18308 length:387 start_codon:yes stop_codon:yes gene_type:complete